jgi:hypothetical protein
MARAQASATLAIIEHFIARKLQRRYTAVKQDSPLAATLLGYPRLGPFRPTVLTIMLERSWMVKKATRLTKTARETPPVPHIRLPAKR